MNRLTYLVVLHGASFVVAVVVATLLMFLRNWLETKSMNVRSRVQRRFVKRELSISQTMSAGSLLGNEKVTKSKHAEKRPALMPLLKTAR